MARQPPSQFSLASLLRFVCVVAIGFAMLSHIFRFDARFGLAAALSLLFLVMYGAARVLGRQSNSQHLSVVGLSWRIIQRPLVALLLAAISILAVSILGQ